MFGLPQVLDLFGIVQMTVFVAMAMFALSQGFLWGYGGIMSFGQAAFFGIGGYAYAIAALNMGDSTVPVMIAVVAPMVFAALLGYFMFYGRISDAYIGVITLTVSVILFELVNSTSGSAYHIGSAELGGFNGIPGVPPLNFPGDPSKPAGPGADVVRGHGNADPGLRAAARHPGQPLRPRRRRHPRERNPRDAAGL